MPNQYNAANKTDVPSNLGTDPNPSASGVTGHTAVGVTGAQLPGTQLGNMPVDFPANVNVRTKPSASGITGADSVGVSDAFTGGTSTEKVIDHIDAPFVLGVKPTPA